MGEHKKNLRACCKSPRKRCAEPQASVIFADHPAERTEDALDQIVVERKHVMKILCVEHERMHRLKEREKVCNRGDGTVRA